MKYLTEEQAKKLWCPRTEGDFCCTTKCMAWMKGKDAWKRGDQIIETDREPENCHNGGWVTRGYCGMMEGNK
jgi:hypothetical protein